MGIVEHVSVLLKETIFFFEHRANKRMVFLDGTCGQGGHSEAILEAFDDCLLVAVDRDSEAIAVCRERLSRFEERVFFVNDNFSNIFLSEAVAESGLLSWYQEHSGRNDFSFDGVLLDLGVSSVQLDTPERGFSFKNDGPLDMRLDCRNEKTADVVVNEYSFAKLVAVLKRGGVGSEAGLIANQIIKSRPITSTGHLASVISTVKVFTKKRPGKNPSTVSFQAIRIEVNDELRSISKFLKEVAEHLSPKARLAVISFHSLEDKLVAKEMRSWSRIKSELRNLPQSESFMPFGEILTRKAVLPGDEEVDGNLRSRSARMRVFQREGESEFNWVN